ncbi:MAG: hypothetical protein ACR2P9_00315 [Gammaproteobacteria bacterium]
MNVLLKYLYRDAGNNKRHDRVTFSNKQGTDMDVLLKTIRSKLLDGRCFVAEEVGVPALYFDSYDPELDHAWHEFDDLIEVDTEPNTGDRDISQFIAAL